MNDYNQLPHENSRAQSRLGTRSSVYHQVHGQDPVQQEHSKFWYYNTDEEPYTFQARIKPGETKPFEKGWLEHVSLVTVVNDSTERPLWIISAATLEPLLYIPPKDALNFFPENITGFLLSNRETDEEVIKVTVTIYPGDPNG